MEIDQATNQVESVTEPKQLHPKVNACGQILTSERAKEIGKLGGRPPSPDRALRKLLRRRLDPDAPRSVVAVALALLRSAIQGDVAAQRYIFDRIDGPVATKLDVAGASLAPTVIIAHGATPRGDAPALPGEPEARVIDVSPQPAITKEVATPGLHADDSSAVADSASAPLDNSA